ncbi:hypothetical protein RhiirB3_436099 [Rhizophagus irregularis]|nr:hypothetical protein RhiirB3_436099 [Rhizophagus irregularis]
MTFSNLLDADFRQPVLGSFLLFLDEKMTSPWTRIVSTASPWMRIVSEFGSSSDGVHGKGNRDYIFFEFNYLLGDFSDIDEVPFLNLGISKANLLIGLKTHTVPLYYCLRRERIGLGLSMEHSRQMDIMKEYKTVVLFSELMSINQISGIIGLLGDVSSPIKDYSFQATCGTGTLAPIRIWQNRPSSYFSVSKFGTFYFVDSDGLGHWEK